MCAVIAHPRKGEERATTRQRLNNMKCIRELEIQTAAILLPNGQPKLAVIKRAFRHVSGAAFPLRSFFCKSAASCDGQTATVTAAEGLFCQLPIDVSDSRQWTVRSPSNLLDSFCARRRLIQRIDGHLRGVAGRAFFASVQPAGKFNWWPQRLCVGVIA